ncbi:MAG: Lytic transglycosylase catalytic, partial [Ilumatobacteraceae bacterium]|nr:Lytic transglycosylase catalytic [Ilumatobacteraceae bacterium]
VNPAPSAIASALRYTVAQGDFLAGIAKKLGVTLPDLLAVNQFTVSSVILPGQQLVVPEGGSLPVQAQAATPAAASTAAPARYVVVAGDYLAGIAAKLGVSLNGLQWTNKLSSSSLIYPGLTLKVPTGGTLPAAPAPTTEAAPAAAPTAAPASTPAATPAPTPAASTYTVVAGDYLVGIAAKNGVTLKALLAANDLIVSSAILPGRQLSVPAATLPIPAAPALPTVQTVTVTGDAADPAATGDAGTGTDPSTAAYQAKINTLIAFLQAQVGKPYVFNTAGPDTYDCSGLVTAAYQQIGITLPHQSLLQSTKGTAVDWTTQALLPGDLIFQFSSSSPTVIGHVGIVIDATHWIQAASSALPVKIGPIPAAGKIQAVRRILVP